MIYISFKASMRLPISDQ